MGKIKDTGEKVAKRFKREIFLSDKGVTLWSFSKEALIPPLLFSEEDLFAIITLIGWSDGTERKKVKENGRICWGEFLST